MTKLNLIVMTNLLVLTKKALHTTVAWQKSPPNARGDTQTGFFAKPQTLCAISRTENKEKSTSTDLISTQKMTTKASDRLKYLCDNIPKLLMTIDDDTFKEKFLPEK